MLSLAFVSDGRNGAMTRDELNVITERVHVFLDRLGQLGKAAFGKIGTSNRTGKKHITRKWRLLTGHGRK